MALLSSCWGKCLKCLQYLLVTSLVPMATARTIRSPRLYDNIAMSTSLASRKHCKVITLKGLDECAGS